MILICLPNNYNLEYIFIFSQKVRRLIASKLMLSKQSVGRKRNYILCGHLIFERQKIRGKEQKLILHHLVTCPPNHEIVQICVTPIQRLLPIFPSSYLHFDTQIKCTPFFLMCYPFLFVLSFITWYDQPCHR